MTDAPVLAPPSPSPAPVFDPGTPFVEPAAPIEPSIKSKLQQVADKGTSKTPEPVKAKEPIKPAEAVKPQTPPAKPEVAKPEVVKPAAEAKPAVEAPKEKTTDTLHRFQKENKDLKAELEKVRTSKPTEAPEVQSLVKERDALKKRAAELEDEFRYVDYERSPEFREKYIIPYNDSYRRNSAIAQQLVVLNDDGTRRTVTETEFGKIISAVTEEEADELANGLFPNNPTKAARLLDMREKLALAYQTMNGALDDFRKNGVERANRKQSELAELSKSEKAQYQKEVTDLADEFPDDFKPGEDTAENELRTKYAKIVDETLDSDKPNLKNVARLRHAGIAYPLIKARLTAALKTIEEHKAKLESFEKSVPTGGQPPEVEGGAPGEETVGQKLAKLANR